ncbi:MAG: hypothetical protein LBU85_05310 [Treponema sp.]|jgi:hypothetical protein|nr:hypothetical protein [Treponema sp.]
MNGTKIVFDTCTVILLLKGKLKLSSLNKEIPTGPAQLELKVTPVEEKSALKDLINRPTPRADRLLGIATHLGDISLDEIREERLAKYLKGDRICRLNILTA